MIVIDNSTVKYYSNCSDKEWLKKRFQFVDDNLDPKKMDKALSEWHSLLKEIELDVFITCGTMLGAIRGNDYISWDNDADFDCLEEQFILCANNIFDRMIDNSFIVRYTKEGIPKMSFFKYGQKIALGSLRLSGDFRIANTHQYPNKYFINKKKYKFKNLEFLIPNPEEEYLEFLYGSDWRTPRKYSEYGYEDYLKHGNSNQFRPDVQLNSGNVIKKYLKKTIHHFLNIRRNNYES